LLGGTFAEHESLETELARWVQQEAALVFSSGYAANVGLLSSLPQEGDVVFSDQLNHASIIDGCRLGKAQVVVYPHCDLEALRRELGNRVVFGQRWVVSETYFSMDGDGPSLAGLRSLCNEVGAGLILDEAHAVGVFGLAGGGLSTEARIVPDVYVGAFGKAVGLSGAFVAGPTVLKEWLWNKARSFVFSTAMTPMNARRILFHVKQIQSNDRRRAQLLATCERVRRILSELGYRLVPGSFGPIVPILIGDNQQALAIADYLREQGILAYPVRPPTVPDGTARLRLTLTASLTNEAIDHLIAVLVQCRSFFPTQRALTNHEER
jgi:8-amino-7-oxononanoate synthase